MGYVIKKGAGVWRPVRWDEAADGGGVETAELNVKFRRVGVEEAAELNRRAAAGDLSMADFFAAVALDWENPIDPNAGGELRFSADGRAAMLDVPGFPAGLELAFWQMVAGQADDRAGNLKASAAGGPAAAEPTADPPPGKPI
ncbi:MAG: hypothetical protein KGQ52_13825 [Alphaproteobacteria bacterium]|nr:hypothetical protein [Alphaproteobacteria bacterium]